MRLKNYTDITDETIREMIQFVKPNGIKKFNIAIKNGSYNDGRGVYYPQGAGIGNEKQWKSWDFDPYCIISICRSDKGFPHIREKPHPQYSDVLLLSRFETLIYLLAHELRHAWQKDHKRGRVWNSRGKYSETDAEAYAIRKLREWRKRYNKPMYWDWRKWNYIIKS